MTQHYKVKLFVASLFEHETEYSLDIKEIFAATIRRFYKNFLRQKVSILPAVRSRTKWTMGKIAVKRRWKKTKTRVEVEAVFPTISAK